MTVPCILHPTLAITASHTPRFAATALCSALTLLLCIPLAAQQAQDVSHRAHSIVTGLELNALGGALSVSNDLANPTTSSLLRSAHAGLYTMWNSGPLLVDASLSLAATSAFGMRTTSPLSNFRITTRRGRFSLSLGVEQTMGVAARGGQRGTRDTAVVAPGDTLSTFPSPGNIADKSNFSPAALARASDVVGGLGWHTPFSTVQLLGGLRANDRRNGAWAGLRGSLAVGTNTALIFSIQHQARHTSIRTPAVTLGFHTFAWQWGNGVPPTGAGTPYATHAPVDVPVRLDLTSDTLYLRIHLPTAHHVVVMGDATDWQPVELTHDTNGWWSIALQTTAAMSRVQLRSDDGAWRPIPGLPTTRDEYGGGTVSLLVSPTTTTEPPAR